MASSVQVKQIVLGGILVNYYAVMSEAERNAGTVLLLHGWGSDGTIWFPVMRDLRDARHEIYSIDFPGFGKSEMPPRAFSVDDYAEIVREFLQKLRLENIFIIGHSFGGRIAIKLAVQHPELIKKLILVDSAGVRLNAKKLSLKQLVARAIKPLFRLRLLRPLRPYLYRFFASEDYLAYPDLRETFVKVVNEDLTPILRRIQAKTLLVWGAQDTETPLQAARIMQKNIPHAKLVMLEHAGHFSFLDEREKFLQELRIFLSL